MKKVNSVFLLIFCFACFTTKAQNNAAKALQNQALINHWYEAPESSKGDTIVFKTTKHVLGPNDSPAYAWSDFEIKADNTFEIKYWRWCPTGNYAYNGTWSFINSSLVKMDFG